MFETRRVAGLNGIGMFSMPLANTARPSLGKRERSSDFMRDREFIKRYLSGDHAATVILQKLHALVHR